MGQEPLHEKKGSAKRFAWPGQRPTVGLLNLAWRYAAPVTRKHNANQINFSCGELYPPDDVAAQANVVADLAGSENVDALVVWSDYIGHHISAQEMKAFCERYRPLPVVSVGLVEGIPSVLVDNYQGVLEGMEHLIHMHDRRRIACVRGTEGNVEADERYQAYVDALAEHDIPFDEALVVVGGFGQSAGEAAVHILLDERQVEFDALVAVSDEAAIGAIERLQERGIRVPQEVSVIGFDDEWEDYMVPISSVRAAWREAGAKATEMALALLRGEQVPEKVVLPSRFVVHESCGCSSS